MATQTNKRETVVSTSVNMEEGYLTVAFPRIGKDLRVEVANLDPMIVQQATFHGLKQKLIDAAAIGRNPDTGKSATDLDKYEAVFEVYQRITSAQPMWNAIREGGDGSASLLARALMRIQGKDRATVDAWLKTKNDAEKKALRANAKVAAAIAEIQAEGVDPDIDSDDLLDELA